MELIVGDVRIIRSCFQSGNVFDYPWWHRPYWEGQLLGDETTVDHPKYVSSRKLHE